MKKLRFRDTEVAGIALVSSLVGYFIDDWIGGAAIVVLWLGFKLLVTGDRIPVLFLAFLFQWTQVTIGLFYAGLTGRDIPTIYRSDYRPMVLIGLGCVLAIAVGVRAGVSLVRRRWQEMDIQERPDDVLSWPMLLCAYGVAVVFEGAIVQLSADYPSLRQIFLTITIARMGMLFLIFRRLCHPVFRWAPFMTLLGMEVALGFTGFFAGFREPLVLGVMALLEIFDHRRMSHAVSLVGLLVVMIGASVMWMGVRATYRRDFSEIDAFSTSQSARMDRISSLGSAFFQSDRGEMLNTLDSLIDRMWVVYYPALAVARVPSVLPHTNGAIVGAAVTHVVTPRALFPDKPELPSDSEMVRKYSGVWVAGRAEGTSIAFGYAAESYLDFGIPIMFVPPAVFGLLMGLAYAFFVSIIGHRELAVATVTVIFWLALYLFERSTANMLGYAMSLIIYLGVPAVLVDKLLTMKSASARRQTASPYLTQPIPEAPHASDGLP